MIILYMVYLHARAPTRPALLCGPLDRHRRGWFPFASCGASRAAHEPKLIRKRRHKMAVVADRHDGTLEGLESIEQSLHTLQVEVAATCKQADENERERVK